MLIRRPLWIPWQSKSGVIIMHKLIVLLCAISLLIGAAGGVESGVPEQNSAGQAIVEQAACPLPDGTYVVDVSTDGGMFRLNETVEGKGTMTVENGIMTAHIILSGSGFSKLFPGSAEEAQKDGVVTIDAVKESVTYSDGFTDTANGFDIPVSALDVDMPFAAMGKKSGSWFDHTIRVSNPVMQ